MEQRTQVPAGDGESTSNGPEYHENSDECDHVKFILNMAEVSVTLADTLSMHGQ
jgi:hypothetical protein